MLKYKQISVMKVKKRVSINKESLVVAGIASLLTIVMSGLVGCGGNPTSSSRPIANQPLPMINSMDINTLSSEEMQDPRLRKAFLLAHKISQAEFTIMALNDKAFIQQALGLTNKNSLNNKYAQCVYDNIERERYYQELEGVALYLVDTYPSDIDAFIGKLNFLIPVVKQIYQHPNPVSFDSENLTKSSAIDILAPTNAEELMTTINDPRYAPLMATIGLPAKRADGKIEDISVMQVDSMMGYVRESADKCR